MLQCGHREFHVDSERIGKGNFNLLIVLTNSWDMMAEIHDDLLAVGIPYTVARMNQFVNDLLIIMVERFGCNPVVRLGRHETGFSLTIAPEGG